MPKVDTFPCPNCGADMVEGEACPLCEHVDARECECEACDGGGGAEDG